MIDLGLRDLRVSGSPKAGQKQGSIHCQTTRLGVFSGGGAGLQDPLITYIRHSFTRRLPGHGLMAAFSHSSMLL